MNSGGRGSWARRHPVALAAWLGMTLAGGLALAVTTVVQPTNLDGGRAQTVGGGVDPSELTTPLPPCVQNSDCDDGNPCTEDLCVSAGGSSGCNHTPKTGPCDDGNRCTTGDTCTNGACGGTTDLRTCHFQCYELRRDLFTGPAVSLEDEFGLSLGVPVQRAERICAPADKNDEDPAAPLQPDHLIGYDIRHFSITQLDRRIVDQFGEVFVDIKRPDRLMVPSS